MEILKSLTKADWITIATQLITMLLSAYFFFLEKKHKLIKCERSYRYKDQVINKMTCYSVQKGTFSGRNKGFKIELSTDGEQKEPKTDLLFRFDTIIDKVLKRRNTRIIQLKIEKEHFIYKDELIPKSNTDWKKEDGIMIYSKLSNNLRLKHFIRSDASFDLKKTKSVLSKNGSSLIKTILLKNRVSKKWLLRNLMLLILCTVSIYIFHIVDNNLWMQYSLIVLALHTIVAAWRRNFVLLPNGYESFYKNDNPFKDKSTSEDKGESGGK